MPLKKKCAPTQLDLPFGNIKESHTEERETVVNNVLMFSNKLEEKNNNERRKSINNLKRQAAKLNW